MSMLRGETIFQTASTLAILVGVGLVVWELKQARELTTAQLISENLVTREQTNIALMGEEPIVVLSKLCHSSELLTPSEYRIASLYYQTRLLEAIRRIEISRSSALFDESDWKVVAGLEFAGFARTDFGRWWWKVAKESYRIYQPELVEFGDDVMSQSPPSDCRELYEAYTETFQRDA